MSRYQLLRSFSERYTNCRTPATPLLEHSHSMNYSVNGIRDSTSRKLLLYFLVSRDAFRACISGANAAEASRIRVNRTTKVWTSIWDHCKRIQTCQGLHVHASATFTDCTSSVLQSPPSSLSSIHVFCLSGE